jgi:probable phosphoglycerate mutase
LSEQLHPEESVTTVLLIRHGHTAHTENGKLYSDPQSALTDQGKLQVEALAKFLPEEKPDALLSSPSLRARASATEIARISGLSVHVLEDLREWQVGSWEGRSYLEIKKQEPEIYAAWSKDPIRNAPPAGESIEALCHRAASEFSAIRQKYAGKRVAIVTHAEIVRAAIVNALGMPVDNFWRLSVPTGSVSKVDLSANFATLHYLAWIPAD